MEAAAVNRCHHGANVRRWREWRGIQQGEFAEKLGIAQPTLSIYEKKAKLDEELLAKIAKELNVPVEAITEMEEGATVNIFSGTWSDHANAAVNYQPTFNSLEKIIELYDKMLAERDDKIVALQKMIDAKK